MWSKNVLGYPTPAEMDGLRLSQKKEMAHALPKPWGSTFGGINELRECVAAEFAPTASA